MPAEARQPCSGIMCTAPVPAKARWPCSCSEIPQPAPPCESCQPMHPAMHMHHDNGPLHPSFKWSQDSSNHVLLVDLPGFNKGNVKVKVDNCGTIMVSGTKEEVEHRHLRIEETFPIPETCSIENIRAKFEDGLLRLFIPKGIPCHDRRRCDKAKEVLLCKQQSFLVGINKNKTLIALAMAAFLVGFYMCHHLGLCGE